MLDKLKQMLEISNALDKALDEGDVDRVTTLMTRRRDLADMMGPMDPENEDMKSGKIREILHAIVEKDKELEIKMRAMMDKVRKAMQAVKGEQNVVKGYLKQTDTSEPKYLDKEG